MARDNLLVTILVLRIISHQVTGAEETSITTTSSTLTSSISATLSDNKSVESTTAATVTAAVISTNDSKSIDSTTAALVTAAAMSPNDNKSDEHSTATAFTESPISSTDKSDNTTTASSTVASPTSSESQEPLTTKSAVVTPPPWAEDYAIAFPEPPVCGSSKGMFKRVVGGTDANIGDYPWMALIAYIAESGRGFYFKCGGSLITSQHTLTAAHCIHGMEDQIYFVRLGELDLRIENETRPVDAIVKHKIKHENYNAKDVSNDIGILVFYRRVRFTELISPICLPITSELRSMDFVNYRPFIAGWGKTSYGGPGATRLQTLQIQVYSLETCKTAYDPLNIVIIDERLICAGDLGGGKDACYGDSGGPLMQPIWISSDYTTFFYQIGVVSFGMKCGQPGYPAGYTRVSTFLPWIQKQVLGTDTT